MSKFKVGDRVRYTGDYSPNAYGLTGTVKGGSDSNVTGDWDNGQFWAGYYADSLTLVSEPATTTAIDAHYTKYAIQPMDFSLANGLDAAQHTVVKYTVRWRDKGGIRDLRAAIRVLELMIEREEKRLQANG